MKTTTYSTDDGDLVIDFDFQRAEKQTATYPGCEESVTLCAVKAGQFDILEWCSKSAIAFFEEKCFEQIAFDRECDESDAACAADRFFA